MMDNQFKIIFACVHSAGRSQMAAAFFNLYKPSEKYFAVAAGTEPSNFIHPEVLTSMLEVGIDLSSLKPRLLNDEILNDAKLLITMGCGEKCPYVPNLKKIDWSLPDPKGRSTSEVQIIRDQIKKLVIDLIENENFFNLLK
jgi:arsenate reductase (thioredoxin)